MTTTKTQKSIDTKLVETNEVQNLFQRPPARFRRDPVRFVFRLTSDGVAILQESGEWSKKFDNYIGQRLFSKDYRSRIHSKTLNDPALRRRIAQISQNEDLLKRYIGSAKHANPRGYLETRARKITQGLAADVTSVAVMKVIAFVVNNLLVRLYQGGIVIRGRDYIPLREAAVAAKEEGISMVFVPSHKSHADYLVLSYVLFRLGIALPHIAAGDNLNLPILGYFLRKGGAFFIRRSFADDPLYTQVFKSYVGVLLQEGLNMEVFIEGTRSRTGKVMMPKFGVLKVIVDSVLDGIVKDVMIVPVSIGYDQVIETGSYIDEVLGKPKTPESLKSLLSAASVLQLNLGRIDVRFGEPFRVKQFMELEKTKRSSFDPISHIQDRFLLLRALGFKALADINNISMAMPTSIVSACLLTVRRRGLSRCELVRRIEWLSTELNRRGISTHGIDRMPTSELLDRTLHLLGSSLVGTRTANLPEPIYYSRRRVELGYYRNQLIHVFVPEAITCLALYASVKLSGVRGQHQVALKRLRQDVFFLSRLFKREFIFPSGSLQDNITRALQTLSEGNVLKVHGDVVGLSEMEIDRQCDAYDFYCSLLWPFIESYWLAALSLQIIPHSADPSQGFIDEYVLLTQAQKLGNTLFLQGDLLYYESIHRETLKSAYDLFKDTGVVAQTPKGIRVATRTEIAQKDVSSRFSRSARKDRDVLREISTSYDQESGKQERVEEMLTRELSRFMKPVDHFASDDLSHAFRSGHVATLMRRAVASMSEDDLAKVQKAPKIPTDNGEVRQMQRDDPASYPDWRDSSTLRPKL